ncbi:hypothetical protein DTL21_12615 [Bremerella cremea]|uniref:Uncharacterized protein n=1 Tax=Blastopirellula marina TaxID=124 RepID=A0A2S8FQA9_9BACT|nr:MULTISPECIES: hypothetical protein [Pirellulaceae]PQO34365.1 hypothetical protein C5Y83_12610 [Blastopirellula marina]RCS46861.1 hypothetical protein DTL21_12615 [Bremerella cremea]
MRLFFSCVILLIVSSAMPKFVFAEDAPNGRMAKIAILLQTEVPKDESLNYSLPQPSKNCYASLPYQLAVELHERAPKLTNRKIVDPICKLVSYNRVDGERRIWHLCQLASWLAREGEQTLAEKALRDAVDVLAIEKQKPDYSLDAPICGVSNSEGDKIAMAMLAIGSSDDDIMRAITVGGPPLWNHPAGTLARMAASQGRHSLINDLVDREVTTDRHALTWVAVAGGYLTAQDNPRAVDAIENALDEVKQFSQEELAESYPKWTAHMALLFCNIGEKDLALRMVRIAEQAPEPASMALQLANVYRVMGFDSEADKWLEVYNQRPQPLYASMLHPGRSVEKQREIEKNYSLVRTSLAGGKFLEAITFAERIPPNASERFTSIQAIAKALLATKTETSRQLAREILVRNAEHVAKLDQLKEEGGSFLELEVRNYISRLAEVGEFEMIDQVMMPHLTPYNQQCAKWENRRFYDHLSADEQIERYVTSQEKPSSQAYTLRCLMLETDDQEKIQKLQATLNRLPSFPEAVIINLNLDYAKSQHRQGDVEGSRPKFEEVLTDTLAISDVAVRLRQLDRFMTTALLYGHIDLARPAAERLVDDLWEVHEQEVADLKAIERVTFAENAKLLLEALNEEG